MERFPMPPLFRQPSGSALCWAYALSSWLKVTPSRTFESAESLIKACKNCTLDNGALNPAAVAGVFDSPAIRMAWKVIDGNDITLIELNDLLKVGYIYTVVQPKAARAGARSTEPAHARVIYKCSDPQAAEEFPTIGHVDPILGVSDWMLVGGVRFNKLILGMAKEAMSETSTSANMTAWFGKKGGKDAFYFTPTPPPAP